MTTIDIESFIFSRIATVLRERYGAYVTGEYTDSPAKFPSVTIAEASNTVLQKMRTRNIENAATVLYEVNIYSNKVGYGKMEAKGLLQTVDEEFSKLNFTRILMNPVANLNDATIYRIVARYQAVVDKEYRIYTN